MEKQNVKRIIPVIIIMLLVAILVIIGLFALKTEATGEIGLHKHDEIVFEKWESNNSLPTTEGNYYLSGDVTLSSTWNVPSGTTNLCLNGHGIIMTGYGSAIKVGAGITLKLYDCDTTTEHRYSISSPAANGAGVATVNDALTSNYQTFIGGYITGGYITGGYQYGAGINLEGNGATLYMYGGTIIGNRLTAGSTGGGGVCLQDWDKSGGFYMYGGSIIGNTSNYGGGVYVRTGKMELIGGTISNNVANGNIGGGVLVFGGGSTLEVKGGVIRNNTAVHGGAVEVSGDGTIIISGGSFTNNIATGQGGALTNQRTDGNTSPASFSISGAPIFSGNTAGGQANDVYLCNTAVLNLTAALTNTTKIGIKKASGTGAFTSGWTTYMIDGESKIADPANYFKSDNNDYMVRINANGEAEINTLPTATVTIGNTTTYFNSLADALNAWTNGGTLKLYKDVVGQITTSSGNKTLDLNDHSVIYTSGSVIIVSGGTLRITDESDTKTRHYYTLNKNGVAALSATATDYYFDGGYITGGVGTEGRGGGLRVLETGNVVFSGGTIFANSAGWGGGIWTAGSGSLMIEGSAAIIGNYSSGNYTSGGGMFMEGSCAVTMTGGSIRHNSAQYSGGGVRDCINESTGVRFTMTGGEITGNYSNNNQGNGFCFDTATTFNIGGTARIIDNQGTNDLYSYNDRYLTVISPFEEGALIGVTLQSTTGAFTKGWSTFMTDGNNKVANPANYFKSDNGDYSIFLKDNEAQVGVKPHEHDDLTFTKWTSTNSLPSTAGNYYLAADVTISSRWNVPSGVVNLCLNGHSITRTNASDTTGSVIQVGYGCTLNLYDCGTETRYYVVDNPSVNGAGLGHIVDESTYNATDENARGTFVGGYITGGNITGGIDNDHLIGGGVNVERGSFTMYGGTIIGNKVCINAGGVKVKGAGASFTMNGGAIIANYNDCYGGAISVGDNKSNNLCTVTINDGLIARNWSGRNAGAIHVDGYQHTLTITGGSIINNYTNGNYDNGSTGRSAGGILMEGINVTLSGNPVIKDNTQGGGFINNAYTRNSAYGLNLINGLGDDADVGVYAKGITNSSDIRVAINAQMEDIQHMHFDLPLEGGLVYCDGTNDYFYQNGEYIVIPNTHHTHKAGTIWASVEARSVVITYDANGGNGEMDDQVSLYSSVTIGANGYTYSGCVFTNWNTLADGLGETYVAGDTYAIENNLTLYAQWEHSHNDVTFQPWTSTTSLPSTAGNYYLTADVIISSTWDVPDGTTNLCLNGFGIIKTDSGSVIKIRSGNTLNIYDCGTQEHKFTIEEYSRPNGAGKATVNDSLTENYQTFNGGYITGGENDDGGCITMIGGSLHLYGGNIIGNKGKTNGGAVIMNGNAVFIMYGGVIQYNYGRTGGAIFVENGSEFILEGGLISYNTSGVRAGAIFDRGSVKIRGGEISNNYNTYEKATINMWGGKIEITGGVVKDNIGTASHMSGIEFSDISLGGNPTFINNKDTNGNQSNFYVYTNGKINIISALDDNVKNNKIGITLQSGKGVVTNGWGTYMGYADPNDYFYSEIPGYDILLIRGEVRLATEPYYLIKFSSGEGSGNMYDDILEEGSQYTLPTSTTFVGLTGKALVGWKVGENTYSPGDVVTLTEDITTFEALWTDGVTITFDSKGGNEIESQCILPNAQASIPEAPKKSGYKFLYWTLNGTEYNFSIQVTEDITLTALWAEQISTGESFENGLPNTWTVESTTNWTWLVESGDHSGANGAHTGSYNARTSGHVDNGNESYLIMPTIDLTGKTSATLSFWYFNRNWSNDIDSLAVCYRIDGGSWIQVYSSEGSKDNWTNVTIELPNEALTANVEIAFKAIDCYGYGVALDDVLMEVVTPHTHSWSYAADNNVITATCSGCEDGTCPVGIQTLTIDASSKTYDGTSVEATTSKSNGWTSENGLVTSHSVTYTGNTNAGTYTASITIENVTAEIEFEISKAQATVNITGNTSTIDYDGQVHTATGYVAESSTTLYDVTTDFTYTGPASISRTNAGTTYMELTADMFTNTNDNFDVVTFVIVADGYQTISPINVTVNVTGNNSTVDYDRQIHTVSGYVAEPSTTLFDVANDISYTGPASISRTNAGTTYMGLTTDMFANTNENFSEVTFVIVADGYQTINQITATVNITGNSSVLDYDGQEHTVISYVAEPSTTVYDIANDMSYTGPASISRTNAGTTYMGLTTDMFTNTNENFSTVTFVILADGYQTINQITATVNITGNNSTVPYDGQAHIVSGYTAEASTTLYDVANDITYTGPESISRTNAGTTYLELTSNMFANTNENFSTVTFVVLANGYQTISPINITVNVKGNHNTRNYDGQAHTVTGYVAEASTILYDVTSDFTFSGNASATRTDAGTSFMGLTYDMFTNTNENFAVVTFVVIDGYQTINPINATVKITGNNNITNYDGQEHEVTGYDAVSANTLYDVTKDFTFNGNATVSRTNAGTSYMGLTYDMFTNTNENFAIVTFIVIDGYQTVNPINVTVNITGNTSSIEYDGQAHTTTGYVAVPSTTVYDVTKDFTYTGPESISRTNVGTTYMGLTPTMFANTNENFAVVTFVIVADGYQTITPTTVTVNVTGNNSAVPYDGQSHSVTGYVAVPTKDIYDVTKDFTFSGNASVSRTNAGTTYMELTSDMFANTNENFDVVTFVIVADGYQTISPINVTVNVTGNNSTVDYDGQEHTVSGYVAEASTTLYDVTKDFTFNGNATALRTNAGTTNMGLATTQFANTNTNFDTVTFVVTDGYQTVNKINATVTITGNTNTVDYDGIEHNIIGYTASADTNLYDVTKDFTFSGTASASRTNAGTTNMGLATTQFANTNTNFDTVTFVITDGYQTINKINATVTITGNTSTVDYDGTSHTVTGYVASANTNLYDVTKDFTFSGTASVSRTNAGTSNMGLAATQFANTNTNFETVTFIVTDGYQTVNKINATVTIIGNTSTVDYDGTAHTATGYVANANTSLYDVTKDFTFSGTASASRTNAGTTNMGLATNQFANTNTNFETVTFVVTDGYQTVNKINAIVTITGNTSTVDYDGTVHTVTGYVATSSTPLYDVTKDFTFSGTASASRTNAGTTNMGLASTQFANTNTNFEIVTFVVTDGYQTINKINATVTITGNTSTVDYDGTEHTITGYVASADTALYDVTKDFTFSGTASASRTNAGTTNMGLASTQFANTNTNFEIVTFVVTDGYQTINKINATVTITGNTNAVDYDGIEHNIIGYTASADTNLYDVTKDFTFSGTASASRTNAGTTNMGLASSQFANTNTNFDTVTFEITDGYQTINKINATVTITGNTNAVDYDGTEHTITGYVASADTALYDVTKDFTFSGTASASRTNAGTTNMGLATNQFANTNTNFETVTFVVTDGYQTVNKINATVTITGNTSTVDYDGTEHTITGYVASADTALYDVTKDFTFSGTASESRTNAGTTNMGLASTQFANTNTNFDTVTFVIIDGYQTINQINATVTITGNTSTVDYDGTAHTVTGYVVTSSTTLYDVTKDFAFSGTASATRTDAGTTNMGLASTQFENTNENFIVTFVITDGYQTINQINATVTIVGNTNSGDYDGTAHTITGYVATSSTTLYDVTKDFTFSGTASATRTDAGTTNMGLASTQFANINANFATVTFIVTDGYQTVTPIDAVVTIVGNKNNNKYNGQVQITLGYVATPSTSLYNPHKDMAFSGTASASRTNVGTTFMKLDASQFKNISPNFANVEFIVTDGYQTISRINAVVTIVGNISTETYDGLEHVLSGYTASSDNELFNVERSIRFNGNAIIKQTDVGTTYMGLKSSQFVNTDANFDKVTFIVTDGYLVIEPSDPTIDVEPKENELEFDDSEQELIIPGEVSGGKLYYAIGDNDISSPDDNSYSETIPVAKEAGTYYVWYKVEGDSNHNDLEPACIEVVINEEGEGSLKGVVYESDEKTPIEKAKLTLFKGNEVVESFETKKNGKYIFVVPTGVYNLICEYEGNTITTLAIVSGLTEIDIVMQDGKTESILKLNTGDENLGIAIGGLDKEALYIRESEKVEDDKNVSVTMTVELKTEKTAENADAFYLLDGSKIFEFFEIKIEKTVDSVTTVVDKTANVLEIVVPYPNMERHDIVVYSYHAGNVVRFVENNSKLAGTFILDKENGLIYIYSNEFSTFTIGYTPYYSVKTSMSLGSFSGTVSATLTSKDDGTTYTLENVGLGNIEFKDIPKGEYVMTIKWTDAIENVITMPLKVGPKDKNQSSEVAKASTEKVNNIASAIENNSKAQEVISFSKWALLIKKDWMQLQ